MTARCARILWLTALLLAGSFRATAAEEDAAGIRFRRVLAPEDRIQDWPRGDGKYLPIDAAEFERMTAAQHASAVQMPAAAVASAHYEAALVDNCLSGKATLQVVLVGPAPAMLPLEPCNVALENVAWEAPGASPNDRATAAAGLGGDGKLSAIVERSAALQFDWTLGGRRDSAGVLGFTLELPPAAANELLLDLPAALTPAVERGRILGSEAAGEQSRRWRIALGGNHRFHVRILPSGVAGHRPQVALLREAHTYDFSPRGVEVTAQWRIQAHNEPLQQISVALDPGLQLISAHDGDTPLAWSIASSNDEQRERILLLLPDPICDAERVIRLAALGHCTFDRSWRLPRITAQGLFWQEGLLTLLMPDPLVAERIAPIGCGQTDTGPLSAPRAGESAQFQAFQSDATVELLLTRRPLVVKALSATAVELGGEEASAKFVAELRATGTARFVVEADVARPWVIDAVESVPPEAVADWTLEPQTDRDGLLTIRLGAGLSPDRPLRLTIGARRPFAASTEKLGIESLAPIRFRQVEDSRRFVAVRPVGAYALKLSGDRQIHLLRPERFTSVESGLFAEPPQDLLFECDSKANALEVALTPQRPKYSGTIAMDACVGAGALRESCRIRIVPESGRVERVLVQVYPRRDDVLRWSVGSEEQRQAAARKLSDDERAAAGVGPSAEAWELTLRRPRSSPFELTAVRESAIGESGVLMLASLPEAASQQGTLTVRAAETDVLRIDPRRLKPTLAEPNPPDRVQTVRGAYRYDPTRDLDEGADAAVRVSVEKASGAAAWVWNSRIESWYQHDSASRHQATYDLQSGGQETFRLALPPTLAREDICGVWIDGEPVEWHVGEAAEERCLTVQLPARRAFPSVAVQWKAAGDCLMLAGSLESALPVPDLPVLARCRTVWLPPGYECADSSSCWSAVCGDAPTWSRRLFGPLGRDPNEIRFDPLSVDDWMTPIDEYTRRQRFAVNVESLLRALGTTRPVEASSESQNRSARTWGQLLDGRQTQGLPLRLVVDWRSLARLGVTPKTPVQSDADETALAGGIRLLQDADLALFVSGHIAVLTGQAEAAFYRTHLARLPDLPVWRVLPGPLADRIEQAQQPASPWLVSGNVWSRQSAVVATPWSASDELPYRPADMPGWTAWQTSDEGVAMPYFHVAAMRLFGAVAFLLCAAGGCWKGHARPALLAALLGIFGASAMLLPAAYATIASGGVLGILFCLAWRWIRPRRRAPADATSTSGAPIAKQSLGSAVSKVGPVVTLLVGLLSTLLAENGSLVAASPDIAADAAQPSSPLYRVLVPIDAEKKPVGDKLYVPESFYRDLYRLSALRADASKGFLLVEANYRGELAADATSGRLAIPALLVQYEVRVLGRATHVRIPLRAEEVVPIPGSARLDGRPVELEWDADAWAFDVAEPGLYRLEFSVRPIARREDASSDASGHSPQQADSARPDASGFDVAIPRVAASHLELSIPEQGVAADVPSACGRVVVARTPSRLVADLGPADRLTVRWREDAASGTTESVLDVQQLLWLKFQPGSLVISAKFKLDAGQRELQQIQLAIDPRLRLLPLPGKNPPSVQVGPELGQSRLIAFHWPRPVSGPVTLEAEFLLSGTAGIGKFRLPQIDVLDTRSTKRWMAVSVDPALDREEQPGEKLESMPLGDFLKAWGTSNVNPQGAYCLPAGEIDWALATRPHEPRTNCDQVLSLSYDDDHVDVLFEAHLVTVTGYLFQHRLSVPESLQIDDVSLLEDDVDRLGRWARDAAGSVTAFLNGAASGQQRLILRGRIPLELGTTQPLPQIRVERCQIRSAMIRLFRRPSVLLTIDGKGQRSDAEKKAIGVAPFAAGRFVESFSYDASHTLPVTIAVQPNRPKVHAETIVCPEWRGNSWSATLDCRMSVQGGQVDEIEIRAPSPWDGPYQANPPGQIRLRDVPGQGRRLVYRPQAAIVGDFHLTVSGPLQPGRGSRPIVPDIALVQDEPSVRWFLLPRQVDEQPVVWQTEGLTVREGVAPSAPGSDQNTADRAKDRDAKSPKPPLVPPIGPLGSQMAVYQAAADPVQAVLEPTAGPGEAGFVRLADITIACDADGQYHGVATFDLDPNGADRCSLCLPPGCELIQASVEGVPVSSTPSGDVCLRLPLVSEHLPQRIEVVFRSIGTDADRTGRRQFLAPTLGDLPVQTTLWTVTGPACWSLTEIPVDPGQGEKYEQAGAAAENEENAKAKEPRAVGSHVVPGWKLELTRLEAAMATIDSADVASADVTEEETVRWYSPWAKRFAAAKNALQRDLDGVDADKEAIGVRRAAETIELQNVEQAERLGMVEVLSQLSKNAPVAEEPGEILRHSRVATESTMYCLFEGRADGLTLDCRQVENDGFARRLAIALGIVVLALLVIVGILRGNLGKTLAHWPHAAGVALGLAWWMWLSPSLLGLGISLLSALAAGRSRFGTGR